METLTGLWLDWVDVDDYLIDKDPTNDTTRNWNSLWYHIDALHNQIFSQC